MTTPFSCCPLIFIYRIRTIITESIIYHRAFKVLRTHHGSAFCKGLLKRYINSYIHTYMHTYIHRTCMHTYTNTYIHACIVVYTCINTYMHAYMNTYIIHIYRHTSICAYIHACMQILLQIVFVCSKHIITRKVLRRRSSKAQNSASSIDRHCCDRLK